MGTGLGADIAKRFRCFSLGPRYRMAEQSTKNVRKATKKLDKAGQIFCQDIRSLRKEKGRRIPISGAEMVN